MFRARQLSHLLNTLSTQTVCANKYLDKHQAASLSKYILWFPINFIKIYFSQFRHNLN